MTKRHRKPSRFTMTLVRKSGQQIPMLMNGQVIHEIPATHKGMVASDPLTVDPPLAKNEEYEIVITRLP